MPLAGSWDEASFHELSFRLWGGTDASNTRHVTQLKFMMTFSSPFNFFTPFLHFSFVAGVIDY